MRRSDPKAVNPEAGRLSRLMRRFRRHRSGATAVEFAMISPLFFGFLFAIMETGTLYLRSTALEAGVEEAKRVTMTGQVTKQSGSAQFSFFQTAFCGQVSWIINCADVRFDVRAFDTFNAASMPDPVVNGVFQTAGLQFNPGNPEQIVVIRAYYETASLTALIRKEVAGLSNGNVLLSGSAAFKNEP